MKWIKRGLIYSARRDRWWARSHGLLPTAEVIEERRIRVYFTALDDHKFGRIGYVEFDIKEPPKILYFTAEPVLDLGPIGTFDDSGVNPSSLVEVNGKKYLYYIGWQRTQRAPYMIFSGLALSEDQGSTFKKHSRVPVLDRTAEEPFSRSAPFVRREEDGFRVWYWSCLEWSMDGGSLHYNNVIRCAASPDGIRWAGTGVVCLAPGGDDYSLGRPWVVKDDGTYKMWYSIRSKSKEKPYRIGYAESQDGLQWRRKDEEVGIDVSPTGWDSEMICFPCVIDVEGERYMFYNGNRHGEEGFGFAQLEKD
jgi:predicted GH43/DUF377 family glycosyl hydrolase